MGWSQTPALAVRSTLECGREAAAFPLPVPKKGKERTNGKQRRQLRGRTHYEGVPLLG